MAVVTGVAWWRSIEVAVTEVPPPVDTTHPSVAVLPLVDMSPAGGNVYLGDGLSEELSLRLAQIPGLRVAARTSAFEFKDRNVDVRRIGQSLGVGHVLEGSVRRDGDNLRVTVQLIDAATGYHVWAGSYDRSWSDVITIQDDIARSVTEALRVVLAPEQPPQQAAAATLDVARLRPVSRRACDAAAVRRPEPPAEAAKRFGEAIAVDAIVRAAPMPGFARSGVRIYDRSGIPPISCAPRSRAAAHSISTRRCVETEKALGGLFLSSGRIADSEAIYRSLVKRFPGDADGHIGLGRALAAAGRFDAAEQSFRTAVQAEPAFWGAFNALGGFLFSRGRIDEASTRIAR